MRTRAKQSRDGKYAVCGACRRSLCRRDEVKRPGPVREVDGRLVVGHVYRLVDSQVVVDPDPQPQREWVLAWEDGWSLVDGHMEQAESARDRLAAGNSPGRRGWTDTERDHLSRAKMRFVDARCQWCGAMNVIDPNKLRVSGIAPY